ncbi:unnamed protein product [Vitrella brassicaformis CCMP3155]|uniref:Uncharacterized protein n=2 Tax=Vitrella brassicaformis TaxID=1169539 RepID=A0A0G4H2C9_VITBC|nr:unnamed protein product [Vitrella brassicaformis CCMP3155]|mmetsp:Transcript_30828/g.76516  ORF Transcript_30828/g.76516 Transcript_30828/m.76516 type:complete len:228 (+) Transcript_30828:274-957(+)|eukprot:CEM37602.1 unnamed protein product [Vitrella brassicaformis CCMP3155]
MFASQYGHHHHASPSLVSLLPLSSHDDSMSDESAPMHHHQHAVTSLDTHTHKGGGLRDDQHVARKEDSGGPSCAESSSGGAAPLSESEVATDRDEESDQRDYASLAAFLDDILKHTIEACQEQILFSLRNLASLLYKSYRDDMQPSLQNTIFTLGFERAVYCFETEIRELKDRLLVQRAGREEAEREIRQMGKVFADSMVRGKCSLIIALYEEKYGPIRLQQQQATA